jgi:hypothetical protein
MSDQTSGTPPAPGPGYPTIPIIVLEATHPPPSLPTIFADGFANLTPGQQVMKFYLYRTDPDQTGTSSYKNQVVAQVVMPTTAFAQAATFFERAIKTFCAQGFISRDAVNAFRATEGLEPFK